MMVGLGDFQNFIDLQLVFQRMKYSQRNYQARIDETEIASNWLLQHQDHKHYILSRLPCVFAFIKENKTEATNHKTVKERFLI